MAPWCVHACVLTWAHVFPDRVLSRREGVSRKLFQGLRSARAAGDPWAGLRLWVPGCPPWAHGVSTRTSPCLAPLPQAQGALFQPRSPSSGLRGSLGGALKVTHHLGLPALWMGIITPDSWRPQPQGASATHLEHGLRSWPGWLRAGSGGEGGLPERGVEGTPWMWTQGLGPSVPPQPLPSSLPCSSGCH